MRNGLANVPKVRPTTTGAIGLLVTSLTCLGPGMPAAQAQDGVLARPVTWALIPAGEPMAPHFRQQGPIRVDPGTSMEVTIREAPQTCRAVVELLQQELVVAQASELVGGDGRATVTIRFPQESGRYLLQARLGGPRCPEEGRMQPTQQRRVIVA